MVIQAIYKMEVRNYFKSYDIIKLEEKYEADQSFAVLHTFFKKKYYSYVKKSKKKHGQFEGKNFIQQETQLQAQLDEDMQYYLEQLVSTII